MALSELKTTHLPPCRECPNKKMGNQRYDNFFYDEQFIKCYGIPSTKGLTGDILAGFTPDMNCFAYGLLSLANQIQTGQLKCWENTSKEQISDKR